MNVVIIGAGNLGTHLAKGLTDAGVQISAIWNKTAARAIELASLVDSNQLTSLKDIPHGCDVVIIAIRDDAIPDIASQLSHLDPSTVVVHTAGSVSSEVLSDFENYGVFYPLQTFTAERKPDWSSIPILLTSNNGASMTRMRTLASALSDRVQEITDDQRLVLHLCATFANNFSNHFFDVAHTISGRHELDFSLLLPLIRETAAKVEVMSPKEAQTGAAIRGDKATMQKHLALLSDMPELRNLYEVVSRSIAYKTEH